jgi:hypothetical protein
MTLIDGGRESCHDLTATTLSQLALALKKAGSRRKIPCSPGDGCAA